MHVVDFSTYDFPDFPINFQNYSEFFYNFYRAYKKCVSWYVRNIATVSSLVVIKIFEIVLLASLHRLEFNELSLTAMLRWGFSSYQV